MQTGVLPVVHGSVLVSQGDSQALVTAVVGDDKDQAKSEGITGDQSKQLMVQLSDRTAATSQVCLTRVKPQLLVEPCSLRDMGIDCPNPLDAQFSQCPPPTHYLTPFPNPLPSQKHGSPEYRTSHPPCCLH